MARRIIIAPHKKLFQGIFCAPQKIHITFIIPLFKPMSSDLVTIRVRRRHLVIAVQYAGRFVLIK
ncbi:hypothetical protein B6S08_11480 [Oceanimonas doudoroffii]|uniref:Uncharacterized protein n=1 Tax=Oceanimonas doudoroffii TaxID=84158 RepID=A0A233RDW6_9GAMM|nr:hypothetical protein B6S08_11480 [Oceanimonas doudoroffii]